jgi:formylglycine-generating enzyme required for sulfatase activity
VTNADLIPSASSGVSGGDPLTVAVAVGYSEFTISTSLDGNPVADVCVKTSDTLITCAPDAPGEYTLTVTPTGNTALAKSVTFTAENPAPEEEIAVSGIIMRLVEAGTFTMGCTPGEGIWLAGDCPVDSRVAHAVTLTKDYYIGQTEVTQKQWQDVVGSIPTQQFPGDNNPVAHINYADIQGFIDKLNEQDTLPQGWKWDLPTEAQWEYAARGGSKPKNCEGGCKYSGSNTYSDVAWAKENSGNTTHPVGILAANELGLYDMTGNVAEMVKDLYVYGGYSADPIEDPFNDPGTSTADCVRRGGAYSQGYNVIPVIYRVSQSVTGTSRDRGFRLVLVPE